MNKNLEIMRLALNLNKKEIEKINFCVMQYENNNIVKVIHEAIDFYYKDCLNKINQGEDHEGKELTKEII